jgi:SAM-dependent methyltransferase
LGFCRDCGHIFNLVFNPELMEYSQAYENSLHFSPRFQSYAESLAAQLIERYDLRGKDIIEIGSGQGDFLRLLCEIGENQGIGFDPSYVPEQDASPASERITFIQDFYSERYADYAADLICCRHVLEHVQSPREFLGTLRRSTEHRSDTIVFFEVPNVLFTLRELGIWDLIYEHPSYFSPGSLSRLFQSCRFDVYALVETYEGQFLSIEARPGQGEMQMARDPGDNLEEMRAYAEDFAAKYRGKLNTWEQRLERMARAGQRSVVWGAGSKGVTFLNTFKTHTLIKHAVDINPRKHEMYVAGTGQKIVPPGFLRDYQPDVVIVMNPIYESEIRRFTQRIGVTPEFIRV